MTRRIIYSRRHSGIRKLVPGITLAEMQQLLKDMAAAEKEKLVLEGCINVEDSFDDSTDCCEEVVVQMPRKGREKRRSRRISKRTCRRSDKENKKREGRAFDHVCRDIEKVSWQKKEMSELKKTFLGDISTDLKEEISANDVVEENGAEEINPALDNSFQSFVEVLEADARLYVAINKFAVDGDAIALKEAVYTVKNMLEKILE